MTREPRRRPVSAIPLPGDDESAAIDGAAFGRAVGKRATAEMTLHRCEEGELKALGGQGVLTIVARADALAGAGVDRSIVVAWVEAAAEAFHSEMNVAIAILGNTSRRARSA